MKSFELHPDRLATTDETGKRVYLHPADVRGRFRNRRSYLQAVLIVFFLVLPWVKIAGRQALLLNITERKFEIFGLSLRAHNAPLLFFVFAAAGFGLFFVTAVWGRVWCGWACPQTVFIDGVFRRIERWVEGPALERRQLDNAPLSAKKVGKRFVKWFLFTLAAAVITHSFLAYFVGTDRLAEMMTSPPNQNWGSFLFILLSTSVILFDFGWFREQFCIIACPYGRLQSVLMDDRSLIVGYDVNRGEPRATPQAKALAKTHGTNLGDCVNCYRCVQVCPVGIDIRRGVQMECIACTACIDACDEVMTKIKKPTGLIRYDSLSGMQGATGPSAAGPSTTAINTASKAFAPAKTPFSIRAVAYLTVCAASLVALATLLFMMKPIDVTVLRAKGDPYSVQDQNSALPMVVNHLKLEITNQSDAAQLLTFEADQSIVDSGLKIITAQSPLRVEAGKLVRSDVFIRFPKRLLVNGQLPIRLRIQSQPQANRNQNVIEKEVTLVGPYF